MIKLIPQTPDRSEYVRSTEIANVNDPDIQQLAQELSNKTHDEITLAKIAYEYVRDEIGHSYDITASDVTCTATEVLNAGHGNCCGKSHLLAAILRRLNIPTGFCYQKLLEGDTPDSEVVIHGLNAVYLQNIERWIRLDVRGNKPGVEAEFSIDCEQLAWPARTELGEWDDPVIYSEPWDEVVTLLQTCETRVQLQDRWAGLYPQALEKYWK